MRKKTESAKGNEIQKHDEGAAVGSKANSKRNEKSSTKLQEVFNVPRE